MKMFRKIFFHNNSNSTNLSIHFLNFTQFFGALNDNVFKYLIVFLLIGLKGAEKSSEILFWVGTIYGLPFLLFSSAAGILADHFSKQRIIVILKISEIVITLVALFAFYQSSALSAYILLFLLSAQSAAFGPSKYSIIPELVKPEGIPKANGLITSFTYLAIIFGTFLASFITQVTDDNFFQAGFLPLSIALIGLVTSIFIPYTEPKKNKRKINPFFPYEIYQTLKICRATPSLLTIIFSSATFLFIGAYFQLNIIPFAIDSLNMSKVGGGYLFLNTAIGIAFGSFVSGKVSKKRAELGLSCIGAILLSLCLLFIPAFTFSIFAIVPLLIFLGFVAGLFIVPLDSYMQTYSPHKNRGRIIAAANFLSFCGVFMAPMILYLLNGILTLSAAMSFVVVGWAMLFLAILFVLRFNRELLHFISKNFYLPSYTITMPEKIERSHSIYILLPFSLSKALLLVGIFPQMKFYRPKTKKTLIDCFYSLISLRKALYIEKDQSPSLLYIERRIEEMKKAEEIPCILLKESLPLEKKQIKRIVPSKVTFIFIDIDPIKKTIQFETQSKISFQ